MFLTCFKPFDMVHQIGVTRKIICKENEALFNECAHLSSKSQ